MARIGSPTFTGTHIAVPGTAQNLAAAGTIQPNSEIVPITSAAAVTLTSTPTITPGVLGQKIALYNAGSNPITLQDKSVLTGSTLTLLSGSTTLTIAPGQVILFWFIGTTWTQINNPAAPAAAPAAAPPSFRRSFTNADLNSGVIALVHGLPNQEVGVSIFDNNGTLIDAPDAVTLTGAGTTASPWAVNVNLGSFGTLSGTWRAIVRA
jgi:hypothetical protein